MQYTERVFSKKIVGKNKKETYLKACKWLATNVISKKAELGNFTYSIDDDTDGNGQLPTFKISIYVSLNEKELRERNCIICRQAHSTFFMNESCNCGSCNATAYQKRMDEMIKSKKVFFAGKLKEIVKRRMVEEHD